MAKDIYTDTIDDYVNSIVRGVSLVIHDLYPDIKIYDYYPKQNFDIPSFMIEEVSTVKDRRVGLMSDDTYHGRGARNVNFVYFHIVYNSESQRDIRQKCERVELALDEIMLEDGYPIHLYAVASYINQGYGLISFRARYETWIKPNSLPTMRELQIQERLLGEKG